MGLVKRTKTMDLKLKTQENQEEKEKDAKENTFAICGKQPKVNLGLSTQPLL